MCGFCTPGSSWRASALLEKHPTPTPEQIRKGLDGNICRCGTFSRIFEAVSSVKGVTAWLAPQRSAATAGRVAAARRPPRSTAGRPEVPLAASRP